MATGWKQLATRLEGYLMAQDVMTSQLEDV